MLSRESMLDLFYAENEKENKIKKGRGKEKMLPLNQLIEHKLNHLLQGNQKHCYVQKWPVFHLKFKLFPVGLTLFSRI